MDSSARKKLVSDYLCKISGKKDLEESVNIFETGLVNSLAAIQLISFIEKNFKIKVGIDDLDKSNFSSIRSVCSFLDDKMVAENA